MSFFSFLKSLLFKQDNIQKSIFPVPTSVNYEQYYNNKYPKIDVEYKGRWVNGKLIDIDIRDFYQLYDYKLSAIAQEILNNNVWTDDKKALAALNWVINNIKYTIDKLGEDWQFAFETIYLRTGDCEDGAILLANLLSEMNIPYWKIRLNAGNVKSPQGIVIGHAYLTYFCESEKKWVILDWSYYPNKLDINKRVSYEQEPMYQNTWFSWNEKYCFAKDSREGDKIIV